MFNTDRDISSPLIPVKCSAEQYNFSYALSFQAAAISNQYIAIQDSICHYISELQCYNGPQVNNYSCQCSISPILAKYVFSLSEPKWLLILTVKYMLLPSLFFFPSILYFSFNYFCECFSCFCCCYDFENFKLSQNFSLNIRVLECS